MEQLRCKACGFIIDSNKLGELCPACGLPRTVFEPFHENISKRRKFILGLNLHPITVHFPQAFTTVIPPFILMGVVAPYPVGGALLTAAQVMAVLLPAAVIASFICGAIDGRTRFKKLTTPILLKKISIGSALLVFSISGALITLKFGIEYPGRLIVLVLALCCLGCQFMLGQLGKTIMNAKLQG